MKKMLVLFVLISIFPTLAYAQVGNEPQRPEIKFDVEKYDVGVVTQNVVTHAFEFKNTGTSELIIEKLVPS